MWKCPKCNGDFKKRNQDHYCLPVTAIDDYIAEQPEAVRPILIKVRETIRKAAPDATEKISWRMPTFWQGQNLIHFAAFKKHIGIYPGDLTLTPFADKIAKYRHSKGAIQFPLDQPVDYDLIAELTRYRVEAATKEEGGISVKKPRAFAMSFARVYPLYIEKAEKKGKTKEEVDEIIFWLTGYHQDSLRQQIDGEVDMETFFEEAPRLNPNASLIKGVVCGCRVEEIEDKTMQKIRYLDKLVDELAKGKAMEKILRK